MIEVIAFPHRFVSGWPEHDDTRAARCSAPELFSTRFQRDAHFASYAADIERRHTIALFQDAANAERIARANVRMVLAVFDVDDPETHGTSSPARAEWRDAELEKLDALLDAHPGAFLYSTRGGHRIVYALAKPYALRCQADDDRWTARYKSWCRYLERRFGIAADTSCADWTRLYRAPYVVRDGQPQEPSTFGNPAKLGTWAPKFDPADIVPPKKASEVHGAVEPVPIGDPESAYGRARIASCVRYLERASLSIEGQRGRDAFFKVCCYVMRRLRMPLEIAAECIELIYNPRLVEAGTTTWDREEIEERLASAARTSSAVPPGEVDSEEEWHAWRGFLETGKVAS